MSNVTLAGQSLGYRLRLARYAAGLSQEEMASMLGVARQRVTEWENDRHEPRASILIRWEEICGEHSKLIRHFFDDDTRSQDMRQLWVEFTDWAINDMSLETLSLDLLKRWLAGQHPLHMVDAETMWRKYCGLPA